MSFLLPCPNCGQRSVYEFDFGGEYHTRPSHDAPREDWTKYLYFRANTDDVQTEWWYHRQGCKSWFLANRSTTTNEVYDTFWPEDRSRHLAAPPAIPLAPER